MKMLAMLTGLTAQGVLVYFLGGFASICLVCVALFAAYLRHVRAKFKHIPTPEYDSFFLGHTSQINAVQRCGVSPITTLLVKWFQKHGPTIALHFVHITVVQTIDPAIIKDTLIVRNYPRPVLRYRPFQKLYGTRFLGHSSMLASTEEDRWRAVRSIMNPVFHKKILLSFVDHFNTISDSLMSQLSAVADGKTVVSLQKMMNRAALDVIGKVAFGMDIDSLTDDNSPFPEAMKVCLVAFTKQTSEILHSPFDPYCKKARSAVKIIRERGRKLILDRQRNIAEGNFEDDILTHIANAPKQDPSLDIEDLIDLFVIFFIAGHETTANTLAFAVQEMGRHPEVLKKCQTEVDSVLGSRTDVTPEDLANLHYTHKVLQETLRLYPAGAGTSRMVTEDLILGGYAVPSGTIVMLNIYSSQRSPDYWSEPEEFLPERFDNNHRPNPYIYWPFSLGPKNCIGQNFAKIEMKIILSKFVQKFNLQLDPNQPFGILQEATLKPKGGVLATLTIRE